jgi:acyl-CoA synthetase (AMP-forming)/AMP-acid ligase II
MNIPFILEKALSLYAEKEAVVCSKKRFTYRQLADRVFRLAHFLKTKGIGKGDCVAILHQNSHQFIEAYFAAAQLGAILNPLNIRLSPGELAFILKDSGAVLLMASRRYGEQVAAIKEMEAGIRQIIWTGQGETPTISSSFDYEDILKEASDDPIPVPLISDGDTAQLYYTSGTTGRPKGVILSHKNVCTHALAAIAELRLCDRDNWIHAAPLFHLADAWATFAITWVGGKHVVVEDFDPSLILSTLQDEGITITNMIPTMLNILVNTPGVDRYDFSSLRAILSGGAPIASEVVRRVMETFKCDYIQTYGMTETSPYLTLSILKENLIHLSPEEQFQYKARTGRPFIGVLLKVVREDGSEVSPNDEEVGEIIVKGDIVTEGYLNRPEETAVSLKDGWLYTGDMATLNGEGYVNIVDRKKDVIITGGENVYSIEIENVLYTHPSVLEGAAIGVPDPKWGEAVKAVVVLKTGHHATEEEIIQHCKKQIARYKAPKSVDFVRELPKTGSGKIYKKGLKARYR